MWRKNIINELPKKGKTKGLDLNFVSKETFFSLHYYYEYHCYTCGYEWQEKYL
nr:MAG TPA: hypothetical protein [Caudoviricetes sp.]